MLQSDVSGMRERATLGDAYQLSVTACVEVEERALIDWVARTATAEKQRQGVNQGARIC
jgi:hypothetical protein